MNHTKWPLFHKTTSFMLPDTALFGYQARPAMLCSNSEWSSYVTEMFTHDSACLFGYQARPAMLCSNSEWSSYITEMFMHDSACSKACHSAGNQSFDDE